MGARDTGRPAELRTDDACIAMRTADFAPDHTELRILLFRLGLKNNFYM